MRAADASRLTTRTSPELLGALQEEMQATGDDHRRTRFDQTIDNLLDPSRQGQEGWAGKCVNASSAQSLAIENLPATVRC